MTSLTEFFIPAKEAQLRARLIKPPIPRLSADGAVGVFLLCHGMMANIDGPVFVWFQNLLAQKFSIASVAFDFHGNGKSTGSTSYGNYYEEADDICAVVKFINGCKVPSISATTKVIGILGHSKGASSMFLFGFKYAHLCPPLLIALSARFWLAREITMRWTEENRQALKSNGKFLWRTYGKNPNKKNGSGNNNSTEQGCVKEYWISAKELAERSATDMAVVQSLPMHRCFVFSATGACDQIVPDDDVWEYHRLIRLASPNSGRIATHIVPGASHFWTKQSEVDSLEQVLLPWLSKFFPRVKL
ncbi:alpha/beta-hydrolase [Coemansia reversa NRRL 1564]|uniref:Alpha/beta-hydrolase n=1 Tax=Coemansia reversa (strain ATCC 12441 / NRRL 1564) TaxID=763665 RepID=A0A2G5B755_COERN|nr:alpha/beta-hydrolase [Coemansia reversa NRRL 1564]|eukprot:PIA14831.1 alpha/beta-hydrolase [Coemansia reversa NRRL 1564]